MSWVIGTCPEGGQQKLLMLTGEGRIEKLGLELLATHGAPSLARTERVRFSGDLSTWVSSPGDEYLQGCGIQLPAGMTNRHSVYLHKLHDGTTVHVPALVLMRGLFRPHRLLLPVVFSPGNADVLGFVDYSRSPPEVVLDAEPEKYVRGDDLEIRYMPLRWLHTSRSARASTQSIYTSSLNGHLDLCLPHGEFRLVLHGQRVGTNLLVSKVHVTSVTVPSGDSVANAAQTFIFHRMASPVRKVTALDAFPPVPVRQGNEVNTTDIEWQRIEPILDSTANYLQHHCRRDMLDAMLLKLSSGCPWKEIAKTSGFSESSLTTTLRRWVLDGRIFTVLADLALMRGAKPQNFASK